MASTYNDGIYRSTNNGDSWIKVLGNPHKIRDLCEWENVFYAASCYGGIVFSEDGGTSWSPMNNNLPYTDVQAITHTGYRLVAGLLFEGFYEYNETTSNWEVMNQGMNLEAIEIECLFAKNKKLYAGTDDFGLWYCPYNVIVGTDEVTIADTKTLISYDAHNKSINLTSNHYSENIVIKVITLSGKIAHQTNLNKKQPKSININNLKSGVYLICVKSGESVQTQKIFIH